MDLNGHSPNGSPPASALGALVGSAAEELANETTGLLGGADGYEDVNRFAENLLAGGQPKSLEEYVEIHQRMIGPRQRQVLTYLLSSRSFKLREYARQWLELAGQEAGAGDFLLLAKYRTLEVPLEARHLTFNPGSQ